MVVGELAGAQLERGRFGHAGLEMLGRVVGGFGRARLTGARLGRGRPGRARHAGHTVVVVV